MTRLPPSEPGEQWRPVVGRETRYLVSSRGRVWSTGYEKTAETWRSARPRLLALIPHEHGYMTVRIDKRQRRVHRLMAEAFLGAADAVDVDHINRDRADNRLENLRLATRAQNIANASLGRANRSGVRGVCWDARRGKFRAEVKANGKRRTGRFNTLSEAVAARAAWAAELHGEFAGA
jgi:hypothetical protein